MKQFFGKLWVALVQGDFPAVKHKFIESWLRFAKSSRQLTFPWRKTWFHLALAIALFLFLLQQFSKRQLAEPDVAIQPPMVEEIDKGSGGIITEPLRRYEPITPSSTELEAKSDKPVLGRKLKQPPLASEDVDRLNKKLNRGNANMSQEFGLQIKVEASRDE